MKRSVLGALAVLGGVGIVGLPLAWSLAGRLGANGSGEAWAEVKREDLVLGVEVTGTLEATEAAYLGPPPVADLWDFKIAFLAPEGASVRAGQPVLGFDASELETTLLTVEAERDSAQKELEKRGVDLEMKRREEELRLSEAEAKQRRSALKVRVPPELVSAIELSETRKDLDLATLEIAFRKDRIRLLGEQERAEIEMLRSRRDRAANRVRETQAAIGAMTVTAPRDGTVVYAMARGEKKKVGDSAWREEKVVEIPDLRRMRAVGQVDEADAGRVAAGQRVSFRLDAHPELVFPGRVAAIRGSVQPRSRRSPLKVMELAIDLDATDPQRMSPGMRFVGTVEIERARVLAIPVEAVQSRAGGPLVRRRDGWRTEDVQPKLGRRNDRLVEVVSGLAEGDRVVVGGVGAEPDPEGDR